MRESIRERQTATVSKGLAMPDPFSVGGDSQGVLVDGFLDGQLRGFW